MSKFCDRAFEPYNFYVTILHNKPSLQVIIKKITKWRRNECIGFYQH